MITLPPISDHLRCGLMWEVQYKVKRHKEMSQNCWYLLGSKGWLSGESINLPPMWPEFNSRLQHLTYCVGWVCYWFSPLPQDVFLWVPWLSFFLKNQFLTSNSNSTRNGSRRTTMWMLPLNHSLFICLFNSITIHNDNVLLWVLICDIWHSLTVRSLH